MPGNVYDFDMEGRLGSKGAPANREPPTERDESDFVVLQLSNDLDQFTRELFFLIIIFHRLS